MPVIGAMPIVMPMFTKIWKSSASDDAARDDRAVEVARDGDDAERPPQHEQIQREQDRRADEPALLAVRREDEVGAVLRQEVEARLRRVLRRRGPWNWPEPTAAIDCSRL